MKVRINLTVFASPTEYHAMIDGDLDFPIVPNVGDEVSLMSAPAATTPSIPFRAHLKVARRTFARFNSAAFACTIYLDDLVVDGATTAEVVTQYLENGFGLNANRASD